MYYSRTLILLIFAILFFPPHVFIIGAAAAQGLDTPNENIQEQPGMPPHYKPLTLDINFSTASQSQTSNAILQQYITSFPPAGSVPTSVSIIGSSPSANLSLLTDFFWEFCIHDHPLQTVHWDTEFPIPRAILSALVSQASMCVPPPRLYYTIDFSHPHDESEEEEMRLNEERMSIFGSEALYALKVRIRYTARTNLEDLAFVFRVLRTCGELRELEVSIEHHGCVYGGWTPVPSRARTGTGTTDRGGPVTDEAAGDIEEGDDLTASPLQRSSGESEQYRFPPLTKLKLSGYNLDEKSDGGYAWYWKNYADYHEKWNWWARSEDEEEREPPERPLRMEDHGVSSLDLWLRVMDWGELGTLDLSNPSPETLRLLGGKGVLPGLRNLVLRGGDGDVVLEFLRDIDCDKGRGCLQTLELRGVDFQWTKKVAASLIEILATRHLDLRRFGVGDGKENGLFFSSGPLANLTHVLPLLESIDIDMSRPERGDDGNWDWDWWGFDAVLGAEGLKELTIRVPSPDSKLPGQGGVEFAEMYSQIRIRYHSEGDEMDEQDDLVNSDTVEALFTKLRRRKRRERGVGGEVKELERLVVYVGDWDRRYERELLSRDNALFRVGFWECGLQDDGTEKRAGKQTRVVD